MNNHFLYCFFKYVHSLRLGESFNVGILLIFPSDGIITFKYPSNFKRIKCSYYDFEEDQLKLYLKSFEQKTKELNTKTSLFLPQSFHQAEFEKLIRTELLPEDEGSLQFSNIRKAVKYTNDIDQIVEELYYSYFKYFYEPEELAVDNLIKKSLRHDDSYILSTFRNLIVKENPNFNVIDFRGTEIRTENTALTFDYQWQNLSDTTHLIKPLSLDFRDKQAIEDRAHTLNSKLITLNKEYKGADKYQFDILVSKPQVRKFTSAYEKAIAILQETSDTTKVIEEDEYTEYSKEVAKALIA